MIERLEAEIEPPPGVVALRVFDAELGAGRSGFSFLSLFWHGAGTVALAGILYPLGVTAFWGGFL